MEASPQRGVGWKLALSGELGGSMPTVGLGWKLALSGELGGS